MVNAPLLSIYVYDCPLLSLVDWFTTKPNDAHNFDCDIYEDHQFHYETTEHVDTIRLKVSSDDDNAADPKSEESDSTENKSSIRQHCEALVLVHSKCFTMSLFTALHYGSFVHHTDVQSAVEQCHDTIYEIDITNYLQVRVRLFI